IRYRNVTGVQTCALPICLLRKGDEISYKLVAILAKGGIPVSHSCRVLGLSRSSFYVWKKRPAVVISAEEFAIRAKAKQHNKESLESSGSGGLIRALTNE